MRISFCSIDNSMIIIQSRTKRGVSGSPGSTENVANYDKFCGGTFRGLSGVIKSPNYPLYYPNRKHCVYDIEVPDGYDYTIKFRCDDFGVQGTQVFCYCIYDKKMYCSIIYRNRIQMLVNWLS